MGGIPIPHFAAANMEAMKSAMSQSNPALTKKCLRADCIIQNIQHL